MIRFPLLTAYNLYDYQTCQKPNEICKYHAAVFRRKWRVMSLNIMNPCQWLCHHALLQPTKTNHIRENNSLRPNFLLNCSFKLSRLVFSSSKCQLNGLDCFISDANCCAGRSALETDSRFKCSVISCKSSSFVMQPLSNLKFKCLEKVILYIML